MLKVKEAAALLHVSPALVYSLCAEGKLEHERYGLGRGTIRIPPDAIRVFREVSRVSKKMPSPQRCGGAFRELDSSKLADAWKERGVVGFDS